MKTIKFLFAFLFILSISLVACSDDNEETHGRLTVQITDAPFPYDLVQEANIIVTKIEGRQKDGNTDGSPFVLLSEKEVEINLVELNNGLTETLADTLVPVGSYDLFRLQIKEASVLLTDGTEFDMTIPSGAQSGLKIFVKPAVTVGGGNSGELLLDFDISRSFVPLGDTSSANGITGFNFNPVIKAANLDTTGTLRGNVIGGGLGEDLQPLEGVEISVFAADTLNTTTYTDIDGNYMVLGLEPGSYDVSADDDEYGTETAEDVIITTGETVQDFELIVSEGE